MPVVARREGGSSGDRAARAALAAALALLFAGIALLPLTGWQVHLGRTEFAFHTMDDPAGWRPGLDSCEGGYFRQYNLRCGHWNWEVTIFRE
jgi:hypothetical protein